MAQARPARASLAETAPVLASTEVRVTVGWKETAERVSAPAAPRRRTQGLGICALQRSFPFAAEKTWSDPDAKEATMVGVALWEEVEEEEDGSDERSEREGTSA